MSAPTPSFVHRAATRLADQRGFTLMELMVACAIGMVVLLGAANLLDSGGRASGAVSNRVDATQRGRVAMEQVAQRLRSQVCPGDNVTPILYGSDTQVTFYSDLSNRTDGLFQPEVRRLRWDSTAKRIFEDVWDYQTTPPTSTSAGSPTVPSYVAQLQTATPTQAPTFTRIVLDNVGQTVDSNGTAKPIFSYYGYNTASPPTPDLSLAAPLSVDNKDLVVRIAIAFDAEPTRNAGTNAARDALETRFENTVFTRGSDPLNPTRDPAPCI